LIHEPQGETTVTVRLGTWKLHWRGRLHHEPLKSMQGSESSRLFQRGQMRVRGRKQASMGGGGVVHRSFSPQIGRGTFL
jgi:hypothetical protein